MEMIFGVLAGILVGLTTSWYFQIKPISEKNTKISQLKNENDDLRHKNDDLQEDITELKKQLRIINFTVNDFMTKEDKISKIKELVADMRANN